MISRANASQLLRAFADFLDANEAMIRRIEINPQIEVRSANPFVFPSNLDDLKDEDSTTIFDMRIELTERKTVEVVKKIIKP